MPRNNMESAEQRALIQWVHFAEAQYPALRWLYAVPNGGKRSAVTAAILRLEGVRAGVPDLVLPVPVEPYHGLYLEMKHGRNRPTDKQREWLRGMAGMGHAVAVAYSYEEAREKIERYLCGQWREDRDGVQA